MSTFLRRGLRLATAPLLLTASLLLATGTQQASAETVGGAPPTPFTECPAIGYDAYCGLLIWIPSTGHAQVLSDAPAQPPYDNQDDTLVGIVNDSSVPIKRLTLSSTLDIFGFDGDGVCTTPNPQIATREKATLSPTAKALCEENTAETDTTVGKYGGTDAYFTTISPTDDHGTVNFIRPLSAGGGHAFFSLEEALTQATVVVPPPTTLTTSLSGGGQSGSAITVAPGTTVTDQASVSGTDAGSATGTVTYSVYGTPSCATTVNTGAAESISSPGTLPASAPVELTTPGTYYWLAVYSGNATNGSSTSGCGAETETVTTPAVPTTITTSLSATEFSQTESGSPIAVVPGTPATDAATLAGADAGSATGSVTYQIYETSNCTVLFATVVKPISTAGSLPASGTVVLTTPGTYYWVASYSGNGTNQPSTSQCGSEVETVVATACATTMATSPQLTLTPAAVTGLTADVNGVATVPRGVLVTGIGWTWGDGTTLTGCSTFPESHTYARGGTYTVTVTVTGTSGYSATSSEMVTVAAPSTALTTSLTGGGASGTRITVPPGTAVTDTATLSGKDVSSATGTVTYALYSTASCRTKVATSTRTVSGGGAQASSSPVTLDTGGTYYWTASYSGNTTNAASASGCGAEVETVSAPVLSFKVQPVTVQKTGTMVGSTGKALHVEVAILSKSGGAQLPVAAAVTLTLEANPGGAEFEVSGAKSTSLTVDAVTGLATFPAFGLTATGNGYTLLAASTGATSATSAPFNSYDTVVACPTGKTCTATANDPSTGSTATISAQSGKGTLITVNFGTTKYPLLGCTSAGTSNVLNWTGTRAALVTFTEAHAYKTARNPFKFFTFCFGSSTPFLTGNLKISKYDTKNKEYEGTVPICLITLGRAPCILSELKSGTSQVFYVLAPGDLKGGPSG